MSCTLTGGPYLASILCVQVLCIQGFLTCRKHAERIILLVEMLQVTLSEMFYFRSFIFSLIVLLESDVLRFVFPNVLMGPQRSKYLRSTVGSPGPRFV